MRKLIGTLKFEKNSIQHIFSNIYGSAVLNIIAIAYCYAYRIDNNSMVAECHNLRQTLDEIPKSRSHDSFNSLLVINIGEPNLTC